MALLGTFIVPVCNKSLLVSRLEELARKAGKLGTAPITWSFSEPYVGKVCHVNESGYASERNARVVKMELHGETPVLAGWEFAATLEHSEAGNLLRVSPRLVAELPEKYRTVGPGCDHCRKMRDRADTFVVRNVDSGEYKQVGRSCLKDFMGHKNPAAWASMAQMIIDMGSAADDFGVERYGRGEKIAEVEEFLAAVAAEIRKDGWIPKSSGQDWYTARSAWVNIFPEPDSKRPRTEVTEADKGLAKAAREWAKNLSGEMNDFLHNVKVLAAGEDVTARNMGIAAAIVPAFTKEEAKRAVKVVSEYVGTVKERKDFTLTLRKHIGFETMYGWKELYIFNDAAGNVLVWGTTSGEDLTEGETYVIKGTVKAHSEYKGTKQTELSRCKVVSRPAAASTAA